MNFQYENSFDIKEKINQSNVAILPIGAVEAHGPHLPLGTDNLLAERLAAKLAERVNGLVLPTLPYGQVWSLRNFPGSINISNNSSYRFSVFLLILVRAFINKGSGHLHKGSGHLRWSMGI